MKIDINDIEIYHDDRGFGFMNKTSQNDNYHTIVAIGTSTGGPKALYELLLELPKTLPATYLIVQHMPAGFTKSLAERINASAELIVKEAEDGEILKKGTAYIAPGGYHLLIEDDQVPKIKLSTSPPVKGHRPSVNKMLFSLCKLKVPKKIVGVIMTGMGSDGLEGFTCLKKKYDIPIIAQDEASCVVYGMPRAVVQAGIATKVVPLQQIANEIIRFVGV